MKLTKEFSSTIDIIKLVLSKRKYLITSIASGIVVFNLLYYLLVAKVADKSIWIAVMMSGPGYITEAIVSSILISAGFGVYLSMIAYKYFLFNSISGKGFFGFIGSGIGAFGIGCPTCGAFLFGLIGAPLALTYLPFRGAELRFAGIGILALSIYFTGKSIRGSCKIK